MMLPISTMNAEHYLWGAGCDGWHLMQQDGVSVIQERVPPGSGEIVHYHSVSRQFFFMLHGQGTLVLNEGEIAIREGEGLEVPPGVQHQFCNRSDADVHFLVISVPPSHGDRIDS